MEKNVSVAGVNLSPLCLGCASFGYGTDEKTAFRLLDRFTDRGGNAVDTANVYCRWADGKNGSEMVIGKYLRSRGRHRLVVMTKGGHFDLSDPSRSRVNLPCLEQDVDESRKALGLDCIPFYWLHRDNPAVPIEEILDACETLKREGKILHYGASNFVTDRLEQARRIAEEKGYEGFFGLSNALSCACQNPQAAGDPTMKAVDREQFRWLKRTGMPLIPYAASARGFFQKRWDHGRAFTQEEQPLYGNEENERRFQELKILHERTSWPVSACALSVLRAQDVPIIPISSARTDIQLDELCRGVEEPCPVPPGYFDRWFV